MHHCAVALNAPAPAKSLERLTAAYSLLPM